MGLYASLLGVLNDFDLSNFNIKNLKALLFKGTLVNGNSGATFTVDWTKGGTQSVTLTANCTFTFTSPGTGVANLTLYLIQDGTGSRTATWPASVKWTGAAAPTLTTTANAIDIATFKWDSVTGVYSGVLSPNFG